MTHGEALGDALGVVVYECQLDGALRHISPGIADLSGRPMTEVLSAPLHALCVAEDRERVRAARAAAQGRLDLEYRLETPAGAVPVLDRAVVRPGPGLVGALRDLRPDLSARVAADERARVEAMAELAAGVAHEVNNALSGVMNYARLGQRYAPGDARLPEALTGIVAEGQRIVDMMRGLLTYARRGEGALSVEDLLRAAVVPLRRALRDALIDVTVDVAPDLPPIAARGVELQVALLYALGWARRALAPQAAARRRSALGLRARYEPEPDPGVVIIEVDHAAAGLRPADVTEGVELARCQEVLRAHGGALRARAGAACLVLPV